MVAGFALAPASAQLAFSPPVTTLVRDSGVSVSPLSKSLAVADFNGDLFPDAAVLDSTGSGAAVSILLNDGAGLLLPPVRYAYVGDTSRSIAAGDIDGDGDIDLVVASEGGQGEPPPPSVQLNLLLNDGTGVFGVLQMESCGSGRGDTAAIITHLNADSIADIAAIDFNFNLCVSFGGVSGLVPPVRYTSPVQSKVLSSSDLDGDLDQDLVIGSNGLYVIRNLGGGIMGTATYFSAQGRVYSVDFGDFDRDGDNDAIAGNAQVNGLTRRNLVIYHNAGNATFAMPVEIDSSLHPASLTTGDFDLDGDLDIAVAHCNGCGLGGETPGLRNAASILLNTGDGTFAAPVSFPSGGPNSTVQGGPRSIAHADMDRDGRDDLVCYNITGWPVQQMSVSVLLNQTPRPCPADFNRDGTLDFFDYDDFVTCFEGAGCPPGIDADFNEDGAIDFFDYDDFVMAFEAGC